MVDSSSVDVSTKTRVYNRLTKAFTVEELEILAENASILKMVQWGRLTIIFAAEHKKTIEVTTSQKI